MLLIIYVACMAGKTPSCCNTPKVLSQDHQTSAIISASMRQIVSQCMLSACLLQEYSHNQPDGCLKLASVRQPYPLQRSNPQQFSYDPAYWIEFVRPRLYRYRNRLHLVARGHDWKSYEHRSDRWHPVYLRSRFWCQARKILNIFQTQLHLLKFLISVSLKSQRPRAEKISGLLLSFGYFVTLLSYAIY